MYTLDFISDCVSPSPHFSAFSFFGPNRFRVGKKSMEDMVYIRVLKTAYIILLSNETLDLSISCICKFLLASEWALPPHFRTPKLIKSLWSWYNVNYTSDFHSIYFKPKLNSLGNFWMHWIGNLSCRFFLYMKNDEVEKMKTLENSHILEDFPLYFQAVTQ